MRRLLAAGTRDTYAPPHREIHLFEDARVTGEHFNYKNSITRQNLHDNCVGSQEVKGLAFRLEIQGETLCSRVLQAGDQWRAWGYLFRTCPQGLLVNLDHWAEFQNKPSIRRPWVAP